MESTICSQESTDRSLILFDQISISDLLLVEKKLVPSYLLFFTYINTLTPIPILSSVPPTLHSESVVLKESFTAILHSTSTILIYISKTDFESTQTSMKKNSNNIFHSFQVTSPFTVLSIIKLWLKFKSDLLDFLEKLDFSTLSLESTVALESFIYSKAGVESTLRLLNTTNSQKGVKIDSTVKVYRTFLKPKVELGVSKGRSGRESLNYTNSEVTEEMDELSFRVSELFKEKFPRFSAASITVMDTPGKEIRKSFLEYSEMIESPRYNLSNYIKTPLDSPKQAPMTIEQVKERLESAGSRESTPSKSKSKSKKKKFDFETEAVKTLQTEPTGCSESNKVLGGYENRTRSCQCSSCTVI